MINEKSYPDWKDLKIDYATDQSAEVPSFDDQAESIGVPDRLSVPSESRKLEILNIMGLAQKMAKKSGTISTFKELGQHFNDRHLVMTANFDKIILVFNLYKAD